MPTSNRVMIKKLQAAINNKFDMKLLFNKTQWYSKSQNRPINTWVIRKAVWDEDKGKFVNVELFKSTSEIQIVLYLRDLWYHLNGWEIPTDNEFWNKIKEKNSVVFN